uniref:Uncharacterized protein n=1 Tax=Timema tahoe TaxID=61484 RepID=A0A7R9IQD8_9NEOP|nr:unnamed protein product [Timema tahoe]
MFLVSAAVSCIALYFATSWYLVLLLAFCFVCFIAVSSSLLNSSVVDIFPTSLRQWVFPMTSSLCRNPSPIWRLDKTGIDHDLE